MDNVVDRWINGELSYLISSHKMTQIVMSNFIIRGIIMNVQKSMEVKVIFLVK